MRTSILLLPVFFLACAETQTGDPVDDDPPGGRPDATRCDALGVVATEPIERQPPRDGGRPHPGEGDGGGVVESGHIDPSLDGLVRAADDAWIEGDRLILVVGGRVFEGEL